MPEGHKTHFLAREHYDLLGGEVVKVTSPQGRFRADARQVSGRYLDSVRASGKHLFYEFDGNVIVHVHLGRYGKFRQRASPPPKPVGQVRMRMVGSNASLDLTGPTTCRVIDSELQREVMGRLGPDPLAGGKKSDVWKNISRSGKPIGALLLDQSVVAGVGNIFRAEILFEAGLDPHIPGSDLSQDSFDLLWKSLKRMMTVGLKHGKIIAVTAREAGMPLPKIPEDKRFRVYGQTECPQCDHPISTVEVAARRLYFCKHCQSCRC
ncbi:MAG: formamidopyrimidine-DNA glycosylase [Rhodopirellula sp.]|nr:formamidopyrimidine-DNA glycosylase [Rhodopirellula sp.]OUX52763.1 MAG: formamidopyrimidine-DNA glycosylase [Rhodopirellula sp. TMED283]